MSTLGIIEQDGEQYRVVASQRITGCGSRFDGRMKFTLRRVSDGQLFSWIGSRTSKGVPVNAKLYESRTQY